MTVLSDQRVIEALGSGHVVIEPFRRENLSTSSYDVCLGEHFYREQHPKLPGDVFNPSMQSTWLRCGVSP